jgi:hypothetical protein
MNNGVNDCGCCEGLTQATPGVVYNRPGLSEIAYRVGRHPQFKHSLLAQLSATNIGLRTRDEDDFAIALLDAWAVVADVLTFYQERIANESYLRTATERLSLLQLARAIGYELSPGVAASTYLAFTLEEARGSPEKVEIDIGTKVQSVPGAGEKPQTFETIEKIEARPVWNQFKLKTKQKQSLKKNSKKVYLKGITTDLKVGDFLLIFSQDSARLGWDVRQIASIKTNPEQDYTQVTWLSPLTCKQFDASLSNPPTEVQVYALRQRASLFGYNASDWLAQSNDVRNRYLGGSYYLSQNNKESEWPNFRISKGFYGQYFDDKNLYDFKFSRIDNSINFNWGTDSPDPRIGSDTFSIRWLGQVRPKFSETYTFSINHNNGVRLWVNGQKIIENWTDTLATDNGTIDLKAGQDYDIQLEYYENLYNAVIQLFWSSTNQVREIIVPQTNTIDLDAVYPKILPKSWVILAIPGDREIYQVDAVAEASRKDFTLSAKTTRLNLTGANLLEKFNQQIRTTAVYAQSELLDLAEVPIPSAIASGSDRLTLKDKLPSAKDLNSGRLLLISGENERQEKVSEVVTLLQTKAIAESTQLVFAQGLKNSYKLDTVTIWGNVATATHGETKEEVLGSGNASQAYQRFTLRQSPLTYTSAATPSGGESTLKVRANDILWQEVPTLFKRGSQERVFITRTDDDGKTTVLFGDGKQGTRLPSGQENIKATYRQGIGLEGKVKAEQLSLLMTRPLGVKAVTNPIAADGAQDPETRDEARRNAPLTVLTLDRLVSLQDYADFARAFAGIGKASATWIWSGQVRRVFVTIAAADGDEVKEDSKVYQSLLSAMQKFKDPSVPLTVKSYEKNKAFFKLKGSIQVDSPTYLPDKVLATVRESLRSHFSFAARDFGQGVALSEVIAIMQGIPGVVEVVITGLYQQDQNLQRNDLLRANLAQVQDNGSVTPAELLLLDPASLTDVEVMP